MAGPEGGASEALCQRTTCWFNNCRNISEKVTSIMFNMESESVVSGRQVRTHRAALDMLPRRTSSDVPRRSAAVGCLQDLGC